jgi:hypothetical protein
MDSKVRNLALSLLCWVSGFSLFASMQAGDPVNIAGLTESETEEFLEDFKTALRDDDHESIAKMVSYSIRVNAAGRCKNIGGTTAFRRYFGQIFTPELRRLILDQKSKNLIINSRGVGLDRGAVWFTALCLDAECSSRNIRIITINGYSSCRR